MDSVTDKEFIIYWLIAFVFFLSVYIYVYKKILRTKYQTGLNIQIVGFLLMLIGLALGFLFEYVYLSTKIAGLGILIGGYGVFKQITYKKK